MVSAVYVSAAAAFLRQLLLVTVDTDAGKQHISALAPSFLAPSRRPVVPLLPS